MSLIGFGKRMRPAPPVELPKPFGRYVLERLLSRGGMGDVYTAIARGVHKRCVLKTIRPDLIGEAEFIGRFTDEAKIMVRMDHPNVIRVFDCGKFKDEYYIAMEYVHGRDLGDVLDRAYERAERLPVSVGLYLAEQIALGLTHVHGLKDEQGRHMGLVHRDVSPQNILVGFDGSVQLIDFGLARTDLLPNRTQGALAVGKFGYMSPEQARHQTIDGRADVYAAGVTLFEVFTGERLVDESDQKTLWKRVLAPQHRKPSSVVPTLPRAVDELIETAVAVLPGERFATAEHMASFARHAQIHPKPQALLMECLRHLYPGIDPKPPPIPSLSSDLPADVSLIIASSRERQLSVFGRGALPVEGTLDFEAHHVPRLQSDSTDTGHWSEPRPASLSSSFDLADPTETQLEPPPMAEHETTSDGFDDAETLVSRAPPSPGSPTSPVPPLPESPRFVPRSGAKVTAVKRTIRERRAPQVAANLGQAAPDATSTDAQGTRWDARRTLTALLLGAVLGALAASWVF
ncbi:MAG: serine/threonine protein kinase [Myxococcota bacterium]